MQENKGREMMVYQLLSFISEDFIVAEDWNKKLMKVCKCVKVVQVVCH